MKTHQARYFAKNMERLSRRDRIFINNPVIMQGMGLAPIVLPATTIQNAIILAVAMALLLTPTRVIATFLGRQTGFKFRAVLYSLIAGAVYVGVAYMMDIWFGQTMRTVGIYLPLLVLEPLVIKRYESPQRERISTSFKKGIITTIGFCLVLFIMATLREVLAYGTFAGIEVFRTQLLPMAALPMGGFILLGIVAALWRSAVNNFKKRVSLEVKKTR